MNTEATMGRDALLDRHKARAADVDPSPTRNFIGARLNDLVEQIDFLANHLDRLEDRLGAVLRAALPEGEGSPELTNAECPLDAALMCNVAEFRALNVRFNALHDRLAL